MSFGITYKYLVFDWIDTDITYFPKVLDLWNLSGNFAAEKLTTNEESCNLSRVSTTVQDYTSQTNELRKEAENQGYQVTESL